MRNTRAATMRGPAGVRNPVDVLRGNMEGSMVIGIRHCDKNTASTQQPGISALRPKPILHLQASYTAIATVFGVLCGSI